ncbi:hypothetical protein [Pseudomonas sp. ICMP22404]|uniref:hypothetical protein n=1 Tax=Pseudomonas sp. ICMP22404 TaxID=2583807 RepID=UPI00211E41DA|nr:hypothetical protein [Pseudomonas sp. ICMP22404]
MQQLLEDSIISNADELKGFFEELDRLDEVFKSLLQSGVSVNEGENWWERGVLIYAGEEYCFYMRRAHGVAVRNTDD